MRGALVLRAAVYRLYFVKMFLEEIRQSLTASNFLNILIVQQFSYELVAELTPHSV